MTSHLLRLAESDLRSMVTALRSGRLSPPFPPVALQRIVSVQLADPLSGELQGFHAQGFTPGQIATTIELLLQDRSERPAPEDVIDLVTTGPEAAGVTNRDTSVVVHDLFAHAQTSVCIAGYAVYQGQRVFQALADRMHEHPDLRVRMFLDIQRGHTDTTTTDDLIRRFADRFTAHQWPKDRPLPELFYDPRSLEMHVDKRASLHAKCVVVDRREIFVSSANFTEAAHERNIEVGLLIHSRTLADRIVRHFEALLAEGALKPVWDSRSNRLDLSS
jgi:phosphatidylserine/phosphatidylglycerophosphate/cardiolipin synthase-like enzyme